MLLAKKSNVPFVVDGVSSDLAFFLVPGSCDCYIALYDDDPAGRAVSRNKFN